MGTASFTVPPEEDWAQPLCRMPARLWEELLRDAERREGFDGGFQWWADRTLNWLLKRWLPEVAQGLYDRRYSRGAAGRLLRRLGCIPDREWFQVQLLIRAEPLLRAHDGSHCKNDTFP